MVGAGGGDNQISWLLNDPSIAYTPGVEGPRGDPERKVSKELTTEVLGLVLVVDDGVVALGAFF